MEALPDSRLSLNAAIDRLVDEYRVRCLWFLKAGYYPGTSSERRRLLEWVERSGDLDGFQRARQLREWLSQGSSEPSAAS